MILLHVGPRVKVGVLNPAKLGSFEAVVHPFSWWCALAGEGVPGLAHPLCSTGG